MYTKIEMLLDELNGMIGILFTLNLANSILSTCIILADIVAVRNDYTQIVLMLVKWLCLHPCMILLYYMADTHRMVRLQPNF